MNTDEEIEQTFADYQLGYVHSNVGAYLYNADVMCSRNGFEKAPGWQSKNGQELMQSRRRRD